jgi:hypothetical protein
MSRKAPATSRETIPGSCRNDAAPETETLVSVAFDDSWSTLDEEVALIDRLFGGEIAALFGRHDSGRSNVRG